MTWYFGLLVEKSIRQSQKWRAKDQMVKTISCGCPVLKYSQRNDIMWNITVRRKSCLQNSKSSTSCPLCLTKKIPEDAHGSVGGHLHVGFVHKHSLETRIRVAAGQYLLVELENFMEVRHGVLEQRQQLWQAEMGDLSGERRQQNSIPIYLQLMRLMWNIDIC